MKYSRFWETRAGDRARSALGGVGRSQLRQRAAVQLLSAENSAGSPCRKACRWRAADDL
jgi:hypothetical protein